jgi:hypothetical protein
MMRPQPPPRPPGGRQVGGAAPPPPRHGRHRQRGGRQVGVCGCERCVAGGRPEGALGNLTHRATAAARRAANGLAGALVARARPVQWVEAMGVLAALAAAREAPEAAAAFVRRRVLEVAHTVAATAVGFVVGPQQRVRVRVRVW